MWWRELDEQLPAPDAGAGACDIDPTATIADGVVLDTSRGSIGIGARTRICAGATIVGPVEIGADCLVGNNVLVRGRTKIGDRCRIGFAAEIKNALLQEDVSIGPQCFVADSKVERGAYLGAQVRTSNHRLDRQTVHVIHDGTKVDTGLDKLGCLIGAGSSLGIQVIILPGRVVAQNSVFGPRITIERNLPSGRYRHEQRLQSY